jgi:hypothetical protein
MIDPAAERAAIGSRLPSARQTRSTIRTNCPSYVRGSIMPDPGHSFRYEVVKTYSRRGPLQ